MELCKFSESLPLQHSGLLLAALLVAAAWPSATLDFHREPNHGLALL